MLFSDSLRILQNKKNGNNDISKWFTPIKPQNNNRSPIVIFKNVHIYGSGQTAFEYISPYGGTIIIEDITMKGSRWMMRSNSITLGRILIKNFVGSGFEYYMSAGADIQIHNYTYTSKYICMRSLRILLFYMSL